MQMTTPQQPAITLEMQLKGLEWKLHEGQWRPVCGTCKGNCGQCGLTGIIGNDVQASMEALAKNLTGGS